MSPIYYIFTKDYHWNKIKDKVFDFDDQQTILTKKENDFKIPISFSSVEAARYYLKHQLHLEEIAFLNFKSDYHLINGTDMLLKISAKLRFFLLTQTFLILVKIKGDLLL